MYLYIHVCTYIHTYIYYLHGSALLRRAQAMKLLASREGAGLGFISNIEIYLDI